MSITVEEELSRSCANCNIATGGDIIKWMCAYNAWNEYGDISEITNLLRKNKPIPGAYRNWIALLLEGKAKRSPQLKTSGLQRRNNFIRGYFDSTHAQFKVAKKKGYLRHGETPRDLAIIETADTYGLSDETIRKIINKKKGVIVKLLKYPDFKG